MSKLYFSILTVILVGYSIQASAQITIGESDTLDLDYTNPKEYTIGAISVSGIKYLDENVLKALTGLAVGDKIRIPGDKISDAIEKLWKQGILSDIKVEYTRIEGNTIFLNLALQEKPRLSRFSFTGIKKGDADKLRELLKLVSGKIITESLILSTESQVKNFYVDKGFWDTEVSITTQDDSIGKNSMSMIVAVNKHKKVRIRQINITGNTAVKDGKLRRAMKGTKEKKWYKIFTVSKFNEENFIEDKIKLQNKLTEKGYRDAKIISDSVYRLPGSVNLAIDIKIDEGDRYYFRNITWVGNTKYTSAQLNQQLGIKKGDVYSSKQLDEGLFSSAAGRDITSLYMDDGYLFFQVNPVEVKVESDSIDLEMRIYEGKQATINKVFVTGNTKTNDKVIMREIRTKPGQLFSRTDIIRTQRELAQLGYFDPEKLNVVPTPNPADGTVDIEYVVEEKPSDQVELSGGWGAGMVVGTLGVTFNNFSARNILKRQYWTPLPAGDGQRLSLRFLTNGKAYQSYNVSFTEPWVGGKKPNALSVAYFHSVRNFNELQKYTTDGVLVGLGKRLKWPDDFFSIYYEGSYNYFVIKNYGGFIFTNGFANSLSFSATLSRNSVDQPIYPRRGANVGLTLQLTPPYSSFTKKDYSDATPQEKYKFIEYHKWKFNATWFTTLVGSKLVMASRAQFGFLGYYSKGIGQSPFERFYLGGDGLSGDYTLYGNDIIGMRGFDASALSPVNGAIAYDKYSIEFRYPISLNPNATLYGLGYLEAGNSWSQFRDFNPFDLRRSAGFGVRIFLPMFGLLGLDWGWPFDPPYGIRRNQDFNKSAQFQFTLGQSF
ncbi:MAG: outer membrane protein assembly factor BamA [Bacteroidia bacterium]|nr:outer membrane protein assembly factor BamA [Bacteroidia bacterium]MCZ2277982.1 outer membrane protein assembly factor BamA [Bacteroidia bacterium]